MSAKAYSLSVPFQVLYEAHDHVGKGTPLGRRKMCCDLSWVADSIAADKRSELPVHPLLADLRPSVSVAVEAALFLIAVVQ